MVGIKTGLKLSVFMVCWVILSCLKVFREVLYRVWKGLRLTVMFGRDDDPRGGIPIKQLNVLEEGLPAYCEELARSVPSFRFDGPSVRNGQLMIQGELRLGDLDRLRRQPHVISVKTGDIESFSDAAAAAWEDAKEYLCIMMDPDEETKSDAS